MDTMRFTYMPDTISSSSGGFSSSEDDSSDDDDCQVLGWRSAQRGNPSSETNRFPSPFQTAWKQPKSAFEPRMNFSGRRPAKKESGFLDPELLQDSQNKLRQQWEAAILRRRTCKAMGSEGAKPSPFGWRARPATQGPGRETAASPAAATQGPGPETAPSPAAATQGPHPETASSPAAATHGPLGDTVASPPTAATQGPPGRETAAPATPGRDLGPSESNGVACPAGDSSRLDLDVDAATLMEDFEIPNREVGYERAHGEINCDAAEANVSGSTEVPAVIGSTTAAEEQQGLSGSSNFPLRCGDNGASKAPHTRGALGFAKVENEVDGWFASAGEPYDWTHGASTSGQDDDVWDISDIATQNTRRAQACSEPACADAAAVPDLVGVREKMKQTADFKLADEEEWARRQQELQKQAQESRRLRKRKRAEAERKNAMENRQKQRLEEIRLIQQKEERDMGTKERLRGQVQLDLERLASGCRDMASLLRRLDVPVEGGMFPSQQQVNAAYKKALLRFHPDRASALAQGDPQRQVEAEETFKLISRMKTTLSLVAYPMV